MAKFGEFIKSSSPTLIDFYNAKNDDGVLQSVATAIGKKGKVIKIDTEKNNQLVKALRIKGTPTYIIYKDSEIKWRQSGKQEADKLVSLMEQFI